MLPKSRRIPRKLLRSFKDGAKTFQNDLFLLRLAGNQGQSRFCFSVSKKIAKKAVVRNKIRRSGYRLLEKFLPHIKPNLLAVFYFKKNPKNDEEILKKLESILNDSLL